MSFIVALLGAIVGVNCTSEPPGLMVNVLLFNVTPVTRCITVTVDVAVKPPSVVVAVMVAVPAPTGVSVPVALTFATVSSLLFHVTVFILAVEGVIIVFIVTGVCPNIIVRAAGEIVTADTGVGTVTTHFAVFAPSAVVTVIVAVPIATHVLCRPKPQ
jgi:hypothetical protein